MRHLYLIALVLLLLPTCMTTRVAAQSDGDHDLSWSTFDGGGGRGSGGDYTITGTAGQPDAGTVAGGDYTLAGGFWPGDPVTYEIYIPITLRDS